MKRRIVVCGATGNQGAAVVQALIAMQKPVEIIGLTRSVQSEKAKKLQDTGITIVEADLLNRHSLMKAFAGATVVFGVTQPWNPSYTKCNVEAELMQGRNIISAAQSCGVQHLVLSSVLSFTNLPIGVKHADSKLLLETELRNSGLNYTILRCSQFMENIGSKFFPAANGKIKGFVAKDALVPYISCKDIGKMAAHVLLHSSAFQNETLNLIGDLISGEQLSVIFSQLENRAFKYHSVPSFILRLFAPEFYTMRRAFEKYGRQPHSKQLQEIFKRSVTQLKHRTSMQRFLQHRMPGYNCVLD